MLDESVAETQINHAPKLIRGLHNIRDIHHGSVVTLGSFDGVHLGHQRVIKQLKDKAAEYSVPSVAVIFEPQPMEFLSPQAAPARIMRFREKVRALLDAGIDRVCCLEFNNKLSSLSAQEFCEKILVHGLGARFVVIGDDFRFGQDRQGDFEFLQAQGTKWGFGVADTNTLEQNGERISSTRIRHLLAEADFDGARHLLGKPFTMSGRVGYGNQLGRKLGLPTANLAIRRYKTPVRGVFAAHVTLPSGEVLPAVANVGVRPTVDGIAKPILEAHVLNFAGDLYGQMLTVEFCKKLRDESKFESITALQQQILKDIEQAKDYFKENSLF
ncbi:bifunctional riboflavin kinase/FAD synthetase [Sessilibacter sp. MAH1]